MFGSLLRGRTLHRRPYINVLTSPNAALIGYIREEIESHPELRDTPWTTVQVLHDTIEAPHVDASLPGYNSIAFGLGAYVGGRLRIHGVKQPLQLHERAVVYDGTQIHSSGVFNGDRWSMSCMHSDTGIRLHQNNAENCPTSVSLVQLGDRLRRQSQQQLHRRRKLGCLRMTQLMVLRRRKLGCPLLQRSQLYCPRKRGCQTMFSPTTLLKTVSFEALNRLER